MTATKTFSARGDRTWIRRATASLPVPLSPVIRTVASVRATRSAISRTRSMAGETLTTSRSTPVARIRRSRTSAVRRCRSRAFSTARRSCSRWNGFPMKSYAPSFIASTAVSTFPNAVMTSTGTSRDAFRIRRSTSIPEIPGILRSVITRSNFPWEKMANPSVPSEAASTLYPAFRRLNRATSRPARSSSMKRTRRSMSLPGSPRVYPILIL